MIVTAVKYGLVYPTALLGSLVSMLLLSLNKSRLKKANAVAHELPLAGLYAIIYFIFKVGLKAKWPIILLVNVLTIVVNYFAWNFRILGLTGGMACGKSTVSKILKEDAGLKIVNCRRISRDLVQPGQSAFNALVEEFGDAMIDHQAGRINRKALFGQFFRSREQRAILIRMMKESMVFGIIRDLVTHIKNRERVVVLDAPVLFESKFLNLFCDPIMVVSATREVQIKRIVYRDHITEEEASEKINGEMSLYEKVKGADIVITNDGTEDELRASVECDCQRGLLRAIEFPIDGFECVSNPLHK